jgi:hypothetical protein
MRRVHRYVKRTYADAFSYLADGECGSHRR